MSHRTLAVYLVVVAAVCAVLSARLMVIEGTAGIPFGVIGLAFAAFLVVIARRIAGARR